MAPYQVEMSLSDDRHVIGAKCTCVSGITGVRKHTAALVRFVNSERSSGCTINAVQWRKSADKVKDLYKKGKKSSLLLERNVFSMTMSNTYIAEIGLFQVKQSSE